MKCIVMLTDFGGAADDDNFDDESSGGIVFERSKTGKKSAEPQLRQNQRLYEAPPSISVSFATKSKFWKDSATETTEDKADEDDDDEAQDALEWCAKNAKAQTPMEKEPSIYLYIVMQLCQKESLRSWLRNCNVQRTQLKSLAMFNEICNGVEYVHSQGMIHRFVNRVYINV